MDLRNFAIVTPFTLNWRLVAPRDFESLEYFITPRLSLWFRSITNGQHFFHIGATLTGDARNKERFFQEFMPQRSQERVELAFKDEGISVFFTHEQAESLNAAFEGNRFICNYIQVLWDGRPVNPDELPEEEFLKVISVFRNLKVKAILDFETAWQPVQDTYEEITRHVEQRIRTEYREREWNQRGITKKKLGIKGAIGTALLTTSVLSAGASRMAFRVKSPPTIIGGTLLGLVSIVSGIAGKKLIEESMEHLRKGLVMNV